MARLTLSLLGSLDIKLDDQPVTELVTGKARALLAYLVVEADRSHRRESLAGLLWPDYPERSARANLRNALSNLRSKIGDRATDADPERPYLLITRETIQFNAESACWVDVTTFSTLIEAGQAGSAASSLESAVALYRGPFLEGFSVADSPAFEDWVFVVRERLERQALEALQSLAAYHEGRDEYARACEYARRRITLAPWQEQAHRALMRLLALSGQRGAALAQYEACRNALREDLDVEPGEETRRLYERIRAGELEVPVAPKQTDIPVQLPAFLIPENKEELVERPVFVARDGELAQLDGFLKLALSGQGRVVFVTGEAGSGKTALLQAFIQRTQDVYTDLVVAGGNCNAYTGIGDPYLPFREILEWLTGDIEASWAAGAVTRDHALRLWQTLPLAVPALVEAGPDLIDIFVPGTALLERAGAYTPWPGRADWLTRLDALVERTPTTGPGTPNPQQSHLFEQYTRVLQALAQRRPLLLVVDDLQWADLGSISLLFHLGRRLTGSRILIVGAYRPEEVAIGRDGERYPLEPVVNEFQRDFGDIVVNLDQAESREFVEAFLDSEPNRLGLPFREMLYRQTRGQPLFTIELLRGMQERGDVTRDRESQWVEGSALDWETLPARVEAVIAERIGRLAQPLRAALRVASVEGELFTAEVVARVTATDEGEMLGRLSSELDRRHRLIRAQSIERVGGQLLSRYRFRHILFQRYLYSNLNEVERVHLHEQVGSALEGLYGLHKESVTGADIAPQLARHFEEARITEKAIHYLHQAGERAVQLSAYQEGRAHLTRGLTLLKTLPDSGSSDHRLKRAEQELALQLSLGIAWMDQSVVVEARKAFTRARELCRQTGKMSELPPILGMLAIVHYVRAEHRRARELAEEALDLAQQAGDPLLVALSHWNLGVVLFALGEYTAARAHLEQMIAFYKPQHHHALVFFQPTNAGLAAMAYNACCLWCLGYPDQALQRSQEALALARELGHPFSLADVLLFGGCVLNKMRRDAPALKDNVEELMRLSSEKITSFLGMGIRVRGEALAMLGQVREGMAYMREGMAFSQSVDVRLYFPGTLYSLAEAQAKVGQPEDGLVTLTEALALVEKTDERHWEAELYRLKGELLLVQGDEAEAEASLRKAIEVAHRQQAKSWELRATTSLARLWHSQGSQGRMDEAQQMLAEIYNWFTEGFDTPDLKEAKALLGCL